jgi:hypothetical protein
MSKPLPKTLFLAMIVSLALMCLAPALAVPGEYQFHYHGHLVPNLAGNSNVTIVFPLRSLKSFNYTVQLNVTGYNVTNTHLGVYFQRLGEPYTTTYDVGLLQVNATHLKLQCHSEAVHIDVLVEDRPYTISGSYVNSTGTWDVEPPLQSAVSDHISATLQKVIMLKTESTDVGLEFTYDVWLYAPVVTTAEQMYYLIPTLIGAVIVLKLLKKR